MADPDFYSLVYGDEPTASEQAQALSAALAKRRGMADQQNTLGLLAQMSGNQQLGRAGAALSGDAENQMGLVQAGQQQLARAGEGRLSRTLAAQREQALEQYRQGMLAHSNAELGLQREEENKRRYMPDTYGRIIDTWTGQVAGAGPSTPGSGPAQPPKDLHVERKRQELLQELGSPPADFEWDPKVISGELLPPNREDVKAANKVTNAAGAILDMGERVKQFLGQHPNGLPAGADATAIEPYVQGLQVMARAANDMGVYRAYDKPLLDKIIQDPTSFSGILGSATGARDLKTQLDAFLGETKQRAYSLNQEIHRNPSANGRLAGFSPQVAGRSSPDRLARLKAQLRPGERLAMGPGGKPMAFGQGEAIPEGFTEVP